MRLIKISSTICAFYAVLMFPTGALADTATFNSGTRSVAYPGCTLGEVISWQRASTLPSIPAGSTIAGVTFHAFGSCSFNCRLALSQRS